MLIKNANAAEFDNEQTAPICKTGARDVLFYISRESVKYGRVQSRNVKYDMWALVEFVYEIFHVRRSYLIYFIVKVLSNVV